MNFDRLERLIKEQGRTKAFLCDKAGKRRNYISDARAGNGSISDEALAIFARELGTTVEYLTGESDEVSAKKSPTQEGERKIGFDDFTYAFYEESKDLPDEKKKMLLDMARFMKADIDKGKG